MSGSTSDLERYRGHAAKLGLADANVDHSIACVYRMMQSFVDAAFGEHPVQLSLSDREIPSGTQREHARLALSQLLTTPVTKPVATAEGNGFHEP